MNQSPPGVTLSTEPVEKAGRSLGLKSIIIGFLLVSLLGWLRMQTALTNWKWYADTFPGSPPIYLAFSGWTVGIICLAAAVSLWFNLINAAPYTRISIIVLAVWFWVERISLTHSAAGWANLPFTIAATTVVLVYVFIVLNLPGQKRYFEKRNKPDDQG